VTIFNRRNALVGFVTLKAAKRKIAKRRRKRSAAKVALFGSLGLVSVGVLAAVIAVLYRRHSDGTEHQGYGVGDDSEEEIVGEYVTAGPEPIPAT
jgi:hypothetical protein